MSWDIIVTSEKVGVLLNQGLCGEPAARITLRTPISHAALQWHYAG